MKKIQLIMATAIMVYILSGCTNYEKKYDANTLIVKKSGSLVEVAIEDFTDASVKEEELTAYIEEQLEAYNSEAGVKSVKKKSIDTEDMSKVKLVLSYKDMYSYNGFNSMECILDDYSNVKESEWKGTFTSKDGKSVKTADIEAPKGGKVLVVSEALDVIIDGDVLYYNEEVSMKDGVAVTSGKDQAIIIFK